MPTEHLLLHSPFNKGQWTQSNRKKSFPQANTAVIYIHGNETWCQARLSQPPPLQLHPLAYFEPSFIVVSSNTAELFFSSTGQTVKMSRE